jgi:S1-C subfamily serine protease
MKAACPNCQTLLSEQQLFCRSCGLQLDNFQLGAQQLNLPFAKPILRPISQKAAANHNWRNYTPLALVIFVLFSGSVMSTMFRLGTCGYQSSTRFVAANSERSYIGVHLVSQDQAVRISEILEDSPAEQAHIQIGDQIVAINDQEVDSPAEVVALMSTIPPHSWVEVRLTNADTDKLIVLQTSSLKELNSNICRHYGFLGVTLSESTVDLSSLGNPLNIDNTVPELTQGIPISVVYPNTAAASAGLQSGDILLQVNGTPTIDREQTRNLIRNTSPQTPTTLTVLRDEQVITLYTVMGKR